MTDIIPRPDAETGVIAWNATQRSLIRRMYASENVTDDEFNVFLEVSARAGLNPFNKQIYIIARGSGDNRKATIQVAIDGYRLIAERSGEHEGTIKEWCGPDGEWKDVWLNDTVPPAAARATVIRNGSKFVHVCTYKEYVQTKAGWSAGAEKGSKPDLQVPTEMWQKMPANQLAKCAEAGALRMAFPAEMSGIFVDAEEAAMERVQREEERRAQRATLVNPPQRQSQQQANRPNRARNQQPPPNPPIEGESREVPADTNDWGGFWNSLSSGIKKLSKDGSNPNVAAICTALELGEGAGMNALQRWFAENGAGNAAEAVDVVLDRLEGNGYARSANN